MAGNREMRKIIAALRLFNNCYLDYLLFMAIVMQLLFTIFHHEKPTSLNIDLNILIPHQDMHLKRLSNVFLPNIFAINSFNW